MIQTLYARAKESKKEKHFIYDKQAVEIVEKMDYNFDKADKDSMMSAGVIARTMLLDRMVGDYVERYPDAVVINIACGLDTRFYRVDNGRVRWYNLDLPETIAVRHRFLEENGRVSMLACSAMDGTWAEQIGIFSIYRRQKSGRDNGRDLSGLQGNGKDWTDPEYVQ